MTLYDQIKEMSVTELAEFLASNEPLIRKAERYLCNKCKNQHNNKCPCNDGECLIGNWSDADCIRQFLMQEVEQ